MLSALAQKAKVLEAIKIGADYYVIKPFQANELEQALNRAIRILLTPAPTDTGEIPEITERKLERNINGNDAFESCDWKPLLFKSQEGDDNLPLDVQNENGFFIISIHQKIDRTLIDLINHTVQGLLLVKPLRIVFKLSCNDFENKDATDEFYRIVNKVQSIGGICTVERPFP